MKKKVPIKEVIIEKATDLFYEKGYVKASMRDLAKSVKMTNSAIYNHFKNKEQILYEIVKRVDKKYFEKMSSVLSQYPDPLERLIKITLAQIRLVIEDKKRLKVFMDDGGQLSPKYKRKIVNQQRAMYTLFKEQMSALEKNGLLRPVNKTVATFCCFGMIYWSYRWFKENAELSVEEVGENIVDLLANGILNTEKLNKQQRSLVKLCKK